MLSLFFTKLCQKFGIKKKTLLLGIGIFFFIFFCMLYVVQTLTWAFSKGFDGRLGLIAVTSYTIHSGINWTMVEIILFILLIFLIALLIHRKKMLRTDEADFKYSNHGTYGTASKAQLKELKGAATIETPAKAYGTIYGQLDETGKRLIVRDPKTRLSRHIAVLGATGTGKTTNIVFPAILQACKSRESIILTDPKGELYRDSVAYLRENGYEIRRFDLKYPELSDGWDILGELHGDLNRAEILANLLMLNSAVDSRNIFYASVKLLLKAAILRVATGDDYEGRRNMAEVYNLVNSDQDLTFVFNAQEHPECVEAIRAFNSTKKASPNAVGNIYATFCSAFGIFLDPVIGKITAENHIDMTLPGQTPCAYFLVLSDAHDTYKTLSSLFFSFLFMDLMDFADIQPDGKLPIPVNFILDEVANVGAIPDLDKKMATIRGRDMGVTLILQDISQLQKVYEENWNSILNNCSTKLGIGFNDLDTTKYFSDWSGEATIQVRTEQHDAIETIFKFFHKKSTGEGKRNVYTMDELRRLGENEMVICFQSRNIFPAVKYPIFKHPEYKKWEKTYATEERPSILDDEGRKAYYDKEDARVREYEEKVRNGYKPPLLNMEDEPETPMGDTPVGKVFTAVRDAARETKAERPIKAEFVKREAKPFTGTVIDVDDIEQQEDSAEEESSGFSFDDFVPTGEKEAPEQDSDFQVPVLEASIPKEDKKNAKQKAKEQPKQEPKKASTQDAKQGQKQEKPKQEPEKASTQDKKTAQKQEKPKQEPKQEPKADKTNSAKKENPVQDKTGQKPKQDAKEKDWQTVTPKQATAPGPNYRPAKEDVDFLNKTKRGKGSKRVMNITADPIPTDAIPTDPEAPMTFNPEDFAPPEQSQEIDPFDILSDLADTQDVFIPPAERGNQSQ